jgi:hypothetical protein
MSQSPAEERHTVEELANTLAGQELETPVQYSLYIRIFSENSNYR